MGVEPLRSRSPAFVARSRAFPLFERYPLLGTVLPRQQLMTADTPVHRLTRIGVSNIWIKRDDMTSTVYGGSKVRKLEFQLGAALALRKRCIVALGATGSHYLLAAALFANQLGLECEAVVANQFETEEARDNFKVLRAHATSVVRGGPEWRAAMRFFIRSRVPSADTMYLSPGGSCPLGNVGLVSAAFELQRQIADGEMPPPAAIVCALGSGGTVAGLTVGASLAGLDAEVIGVRVYPSHAGPVPTMTCGRVRKLMRRTWRLLADADPGIPAIRIGRPRIAGEYLGNGYARPTDAGLRAQRLLAETEGVALDSTYTAKTFAAVLDLRRVFGSRPILYWHTYAGAADPALSNPRTVPCAI